jgi:hypothetical protein
MSILGAILGIGGGLISANATAAEAKKARKAEQKRIDQQYKYDKQVDEFNWDTILRQYDYAQQEVGVARDNQEQLLKYQEESAQRDYQYNLKIRNYEYRNQVRQYRESERIYGLQLQFNNQAAEVAKEAEALKFQDILAEMAFDQQDLFVKMLQEEGQAQARGVSGRSAEKVLQASIASYGRNQAILAQSLVSAEKANAMAMRQIDTEKRGADLAAQSRRMLVPVKGPAPPEPLPLPRAVLLDPLEPKRGPKPMKGVNTMPIPSGLTIANSFIGGAMQGLSLGNSLSQMKF